jgi:tRNA(Ile2) C34 agmatinyltransferase TiaS
MSDWQVHITDDWRHVDTSLVVIYRTVRDGVEVMRTPGEVVELDAGTSMVGEGMLLPTSALKAIAERLKPGASAGEVKRLEDALEVERRRVDDVLRRRP